MFRKLFAIVVSLTVLWLLSTVSVPRAAGEEFRSPFPPATPSNRQLEASNRQPEQSAKTPPAAIPKLMLPVPSSPQSSGPSQPSAARIYRLGETQRRASPVRLQPILTDEWIATPNSQTPGHSLPLLTPPDQALSDLQLADPAHQSGVCPCNDNHWFVSVRNCTRQCRACAHCCELEFFTADVECCTKRSDADGFVAGLRSGVPVCIVVHGSYVTAESAKEDCRETFKWLRHVAPQLPLHVVFFSWPSDAPFALDPGNALTSAVPQLDVAILGRRAELNGIRLARLIELIPEDSPICVIGHSHGARMVASALHLIGGGQLSGIGAMPISKPHRIRTVLAAAAIDHDWLSPHQRYGRAMMSTEALLNLRSRMDWALWFYPFRRPFSPDSLGRRGFTQRDLHDLGPHRSLIAEYDVTQSIGVGHIWPHYYGRPEIAAILKPYVYFTE